MSPREATGDVGHALGLQVPDRGENPAVVAVGATTAVAAMIVARDALWFFVTFSMHLTLRMVNDQRQRASARCELGDNPPERAVAAGLWTTGDSRARLEGE
jgi:hypothetical protein